MRSKTETAAVAGGNCKVAMRSLANAVVVIAACKGSISNFFMRAKLSGMMKNWIDNNSRIHWTLYHQEGVVDSADMSVSVAGAVVLLASEPDVHYCNDSTRKALRSGKTHHMRDFVQHLSVKPGTLPHTNFAKHVQCMPILALSHYHLD
jgi:hypothetical protein